MLSIVLHCRDRARSERINPKVCGSVKIICEPALKIGAEETMCYGGLQYDILSEANASSFHLRPYFYSMRIVMVHCHWTTQSF